MCLQDNGIENTIGLEKIKRFLSKNFSLLELNANKIIEITKTNKIEGSALKILSGGHSGQIKYTEGTYLDYLIHEI